MISTTEKRNHLISFTLTSALFMIMFFFILQAVGGEYGGEFVSGESTAGDPGDNVQLEITFKNTGDQETTFTLYDPELPLAWESSWPGGNNKTILPDTSSILTIEIQIPSDYQYARAGAYSFDVIGEFETDSDPEPMLGGALLEVFVNPVHGVEVDPEEFSGSNTNPGESIPFQVEVTNTGNANDSFIFEFTKESGPSNGALWFSVTNQTHGNDVFIIMNETIFVDIMIDIPAFTQENYEAMAGTYRIEIIVSSQNDSEEKGQVMCEFGVEKWYNPDISIILSGKTTVVHPIRSTRFEFEPKLTNGGNANDDIEISVPASELTGEKEGWEVSIDSQNRPTYSINSRFSEFITIQIGVDNATDPGNYTLVVIARSMGDSSIWDSIVLYVNLTEPVIDVKLSRIGPIIYQVDPMYHQQVEYGFAIENIGNIDDSYLIIIETILTTGVYKDWKIELQDKQGNPHHSLQAPSELSGNDMEDGLDPGSRIESGIYITPFENASAGLYDEIHVSVTSLSDLSRVWNLDISIELIRADLAVFDDPDKFSIEPASEIELGDSIDVNVEVHNIGSAEASEFDVWFYTSRSLSPDGSIGPYFATRTISSLPADSKVEIQVTLAVIEVGRNDIFIFVDKPITEGLNKTYLFGAPSPLGEVPEENENNNNATLPSVFHSEIDHSPDLSIRSVNISTTVPGEYSVVSVTVLNDVNTTIPSGYSSITAEIDGIFLNDTIHGSTLLVLDAIEPMGSRTIHFEWDVPLIEGSSNLTVSLSVAMDRTPENNMETILLFVSDDASIGPDIIVSSIQLMTQNGSEPRVGDALRIVVTVRNEGDTAGNINYTISLKSDPPVELRLKKLSLNAGEQSTYTHGWIPTKKGEYTIIVEIINVDPEDHDSSDNRREFIVEIKGTSGSSSDSNFISFPSPLLLISLLLITSVIFKKRKERNS